jgi:hypothetical protein
MTNAIKVLLQMTSVSLQPVPSLQRQPRFFYYIRWLVFLNLKFVINIDGKLCVKRCTYLRPKDLYALGRIKAPFPRASNFVRGRKVNLSALYT